MALVGKSARRSRLLRIGAGLGNKVQSMTSHVALTKSSTRSFAFTLAEVLITLGIIGVVAAMTLLVIMSHYRKQEASARLKKFYSAMSQAILLSEVENGDFKYWDIQDISVPSLDDSSHDYDKAGEIEAAFFTNTSLNT